MYFPPRHMHPLIGHSDTRRRLAQAHADGRLPQVLLVTGPAGVGRQRLALWLGQLVLCEHPALEPCGDCPSCRRVLELAHPDLHWFVPIVRPKASDPDKQVDEAAELLTEVMDERRKQPLYGPPDGMASHGIASVRLLQRRAALTAAEGGRTVFIVGDAERLVPQESSQEAANALLKLLEEPPPRALFILTALDPRRLLPTIRSRAVAVRLGRLADADVRGFLETHAQPPLRGAELEARVAAAEGLIGAAVGEGDGGKARTAAVQLLEAVMSGSGPRLERALKQPPYAARGEFTTLLDAVADTLGEAARGALGHPVRGTLPDRLLQHQSPAPLLRALERVEAAREAAGGNVNPQILLAVLSGELAEVL